MTTSTQYRGAPTQFRQSDEERAELVKRATAAGVNVSQFLREAVYLRYAVDRMGTAVPLKRRGPKKRADR